MEANYTYEKFDENGKVTYCPGNDYDGSITGHIVMNVKAWFDENPEERKRLGWIKHIHHSTKDVEYNHATQRIVWSAKKIDDYTIEDEYHIVDKSEEMLRLEELLEALNYNSGDFVTFLNGGT